MSKSFWLLNMYYKFIYGKPCTYKYFLCPKLIERTCPRALIRIIIHILMKTLHHFTVTLTQCTMRWNSFLSKTQICTHFCRWQLVSYCCSCFCSKLFMHLCNIERLQNSMTFIALLAFLSLGQLNLIICWYMLYVVSWDISCYNSEKVKKDATSEIIYPTICHFGDILC